MQQYRDSVLGILACLVGLTMAAAAHAQAPRSKVEMPATPGVPEFRDPKTGQIWTPLNVGQQSGPPTPADLAFDPMGQAVSVRGVVVQRPSVVPLDAVPITAGPTVPIVNLGDATLRAVPGKRWQVVLYLDNNSAGVVVPVINCRFTNAGNLVEQTHVLVPAVGPGLRVGMTIYGPKTDLFVDRAACAVTSP
ncbi:MAG: hypothetical protein QOG78_3862 [Rhodospirillaceae bacterium]|nr:hypothetical protein [Rhodospirillaceae bacterium]MEA2848581.1 hypothetical protein [Rhodospirillaceae bacterium]